MSPDTSWKQHERAVADLIGGKRLPASSHETVDCEGPRFVAQAKLVQRMSLDELTLCAEKIAEEATTRGKLGVVGVKVRRGAGVKSPVLMVMTDQTFRRLLGYTDGDSASAC